MKKSANIWMAVLTMTAVIMGVLLLVPQRPANGVMLNAQAGFSLMTTGTPGGDELLTVIDKSTEKIIIYNLQGTNLVPLAKGSFGTLFH